MEEISIKKKERHLYKREDHLLEWGQSRGQKEVKCVERSNSNKRDLSRE
jgi:hypothetical protein